MDYMQKVPNPAPQWVAPFLAAVQDESLDARVPSRRALLVAGALTSATGPNRDRWVHRFAVYLDLHPLQLYDLERSASPEAPIEQAHDHINARVDRIRRGAAA